MTLLENIKSPVWSISLNAFGEIVQGITAIRQRIQIALTTSKGSDPMRPEFGTNIYKYQDAPVTVAVTEVKKEILNALQIWVTDIENVKVTAKVIYDSQITFNIGYTLVNSEIFDDLLYELNNGTFTNATQKLTLQSFFPENLLNLPYKVDLVLNNEAVNPTPPPTGFDSIELLFGWINSNWGYRATWLLQPDQIIAYIKDVKFITGRFAISLLNFFKISTSIPVLNPGEKWVVRFQPDTTAENYLADNPFYTLGDLIAGMQAQFGEYGTWSLETTNGEFNNDFGGDFNVSNTKLVLTTLNYNNAVITITKE